MMKRQCPECRYWFATPELAPTTTYPDCSEFGLHSHKAVRDNIIGRT